MNKIFFLCTILIPLILYADTYNEALKYDAKGDSEKASELFHDYFDNNINDVNQDGIIEKLLYSSTLLPTIDDSMEYMLHYVKYMKTPTSRFRIYNKLAEIYELTGNIYDAGVFYEKAAYTMDDYVDFNSLLNSIEMLVELGFHELSINKLKEILTESEETTIKDRCNLLLSRIYKIMDKNSNAIGYILNVKSETGAREFYKHELGISNNLGSMSSDNFEKIIVYSPYQKLKTPTDYIGIDSELKIIPKGKHFENREEEILIGTYSDKKDAAGIINLANQLNLPWFFDNTNDGYTLYLFSEDKIDTIDKLRKLGIEVR